MTSWGGAAPAGDLVVSDTGIPMEPVASGIPPGLGEDELHPLSWPIPSCWTSIASSLLAISLRLALAINLRLALALLVPVAGIAGHGGLGLSRMLGDPLVVGDLVCLGKGRVVVVVVVLVVLCSWNWSCRHAGGAVLCSSCSSCSSCSNSSQD